MKKLTIKKAMGVNTWQDYPECQLFCDNDTDIKEALKVIQGVPLLWLAEELLEEKYSGNQIEGKVSFNRNNESIEFISIKSKRVLAKAHFENFN